MIEAFLTTTSQSMRGGTMIQSIEQLELGVRVRTLKEAVEACRNRKEQDQREEDEFMDMLAQAEAQVLGKAPGSEGVELSGLIAEGENPYTAKAEPEPEPTPDEQHAVEEQPA
jgi:hypothetical protein